MQRARVRTGPACILTCTSACAKACPTGAITYVDAEWTGLDKMRAWAARANTQPHAA